MTDRGRPCRSWFFHGKSREQEAGLRRLNQIWSCCYGLASSVQFGLCNNPRPLRLLRGFDVRDRHDYIVCRCEDVLYSAVEQCRADAGEDVSLRELKLRLRVGMGWCQGRVCGPVIAELIGATASLDPSQVVRPVRLGQIAGLIDSASS